LNTKQQEIADYIKENLDEIEPALLEKIAVIVSKYITERQYPDPSVEMSKAKEKIKELEIELSKRDKMNEDVKIKLSQLEQALSEKEIMLSDKEKELEAKAIELAEKEAKLKEYEAKIQEIELSSKKTELLSKIKAIEPEFDEEVILSKPLNEQISFLDTYYTIVSSKGKPAQKEDIQLSAPQNSVEQRYRKLFDL
jgi:chromosome segregation ATPase